VGLETMVPPSRSMEDVRVVKQFDITRVIHEGVVRAELDTWRKLLEVKAVVETSG
jgi:hypothetical protein